MTINGNMGIVFNIKLCTREGLRKNTVNGILDLKLWVDRNFMKTLYKQFAFSVRECR